MVGANGDWLDYLSRMLELEKAVNVARIDSPRHAAYLDGDERIKKDKDLSGLGRMVAASELSAEDKDTLLDVVEKSKSNLQAYSANDANANSGAGENNGSAEALKYALFALLAGGMGFGIGWHAKSVYEEHKGKQAKEIAEIVNMEMGEIRG